VKRAGVAATTFVNGALKIRYRRHAHHRTIPKHGPEDSQPTSPMPNETRTHRGILREIRTDRGDWMPLRRTTPNTRTHHKTLQIPREIPAQPGPRKKCQIGRLLGTIKGIRKLTTFIRRSNAFDKDIQCQREEREGARMEEEGWAYFMQTEAG